MATKTNHLAKHLAETLRTFGWPPVMMMPIACRYTCRSRSTLTRAVQAGELVAAGRHKRSLTFRREDLDRWIIGETSHQSIAPSAARYTASSPSTTSDAIARLDAIKRGA